MSRRQLRLLALAALCYTLAEASIPSYMKVCGRRNPKLNECVKDSVLQLKPKLQSGIPELDVPSLEPLYFDEVILATLPDFTAVAKNLTLNGLSNFEIRHLNIDLEKNRIDLELLLAKVLMKSDYNVKARIIVPINEKGPIDLTSENVIAKVVLKFKKVERRGRTLIYFPTMSCKLLIEDYTANFRSGASESTISQAINEILVTNRKEIIDSMTPNLEKAVSSKVIDVANRVCKHFTFDDLLPDRL
ncbi:uncharacterized protein LOC131671030 [Phymastichus coffea]|uniref:uncharacterized protein LOC131671030 n=1 Tax=Phymastichus coffea TaxID=108790 RepID=UPI00273B6512|nr:uncharacterized protein LOC131671030 [Phymastichus coffea]